MSLATRKIKHTLDAHNAALGEQLNQQLETAFEIQYDGSCLPEDIAGWNWDDERLKTCFYNAYYRPVERALAEMFQDAMYKEAVLEQVKAIRFETGRSALDYDFVDGALVVKHRLSVNFHDCGGGIMGDQAVKSVIQTLESKLQ
ncbi:MAG: hypothetical protein R3F62_04180 [Planctomycetota bacterium]